MELVLLILAIVGIRCLYRYSIAHEIHMKSTPPRNLPIQYAYTIDEWYSLRTRFDSLIEADWQAYRDNSISRATYKARCEQAVGEIIPPEYRSKFPTLYRWGARTAAMRVVKEGYHPGMIDFAAWNRRALIIWKPEDYHPSSPNEHNGQSGWMKCIPGRNCFLDLYPKGELLEIMGCGSMQNGVWTSEKKSDTWCQQYYTHLSIYEPERDKAIAYFQKRGYNGQTYSCTARNFGSLTQEEIAKKYEFILTEPETGNVEHSAQCRAIINPNQKLRERTKQMNEAMSERERLAKIQKEIQN